MQEKEKLTQEEELLEEYLATLITPNIVPQTSCLFDWKLSLTGG